MALRRRGRDWYLSGRKLKPGDVIEFQNPPPEWCHDNVLDQAEGVWERFEITAELLENDDDPHIMQWTSVESLARTGWPVRWVKD